MEDEMAEREIQIWLDYWNRGNMVAIDEIQAFEHVYQARKYCSCMRFGVFSPDIVTDLQIWRALQSMRAATAA
jgi:hypothetical protein